MVWSCEVTAVGGQGGTTAATVAAAAGGGGLQQQGHPGAPAGALPPAQIAVAAVPAAAAAAVARQTYPTHCLLALLKGAALLEGAPQSVSMGILKLLLDALLDVPNNASPPWAKLLVLLSLAQACFEAGWGQQLMLVVEAAGWPRVGQLRFFLRELRSQLQLPHGQQQQQEWEGCVGGSSSSGSDAAPGARHSAGGVGSSGGGAGTAAGSTVGRVSSSRGSSPAGRAGFSHGGSSSGSIAAGSSTDSSSGSSANSAGSGDVLEAAVTLMEQAQANDLVSSLLAQSYLSVCMPGEYLGATARPAQPAVHIPSLSNFTRLLMRLGLREELPPGARCRDLPLFRLLVRTVLQSCDVDALHALLLFMQRHGGTVVQGMPEDALRALRVEAEAVQAAEGAQAGGGGAGE